MGKSENRISVKGVIAGTAVVVLAGLTVKACLDADSTDINPDNQNTIPHSSQIVADEVRADVENTVANKVTPKTDGGSPPDDVDGVPPLDMKTLEFLFSLSNKMHPLELEKQGYELEEVFKVLADGMKEGNSVAYNFAKILAKEIIENEEPTEECDFPFDRGPGGCNWRHRIELEKKAAKLIEDRTGLPEIILRANKLALDHVWDNELLELDAHSEIGRTGRVRLNRDEQTRTVMESFVRTFSIFLNLLIESDDRTALIDLFCNAAQTSRSELIDQILSVLAFWEQTPESVRGEHLGGKFGFQITQDRLSKLIESLQAY